MNQRDQAIYELHESIEQPGLERAHSGLLAANSSLPGCPSDGLRELNRINQCSDGQKLMSR